MAEFFGALSDLMWQAVGVLVVPLSIVALSIGPIAFERWWTTRSLMGSTSGGLRNLCMMVNAYLTPSADALPLAWDVQRFACAALCCWLPPNVEGIVEATLSGPEWCASLRLLTPEEARELGELRFVPKHEMCLQWAELALGALARAQTHGAPQMMNLQLQLSELRTNFTTLTRYKATLPPRVLLTQVAIAVDTFSWVALLGGVGSIIGPFADEATDGLGIPPTGWSNAEHDAGFYASRIAVALSACVVPFVYHLCSSLFLDTLLLLMRPFSSSPRVGLKFASMWGAAVCASVELHLVRARALQVQPASSVRDSESVVVGTD